jgi:sulfate transport system ATP-binding protein
MTTALLCERESAPHASRPASPADASHLDWLESEAIHHGRIEQAGTPVEVYDHPATPFVVEFLGHVNRLPVAGEPDASGFARPHEIAVLGQPEANAWPARLIHTATVGPVARLEFALERDQRTVNVELTREVARELALPRGAVAYLRPTQLRRYAGT